jgi:acetolactate synthase-1/2/3 large subunit
MEAAGKASFRVRTPGDAFGVLSTAAALALSAPMGPVTVEIPIDVQRAAVERPAALDRLRLPVFPPAPAAETDLDAVAERLLAARRPMLWLGNGAKGAGVAALMLLELGFCCVSSWNVRGIVPEDHPATLGALNGSGSPEIEDFYETVDAMLVVGSRLRGHETSDFRMRLPRTLILVDVDPRANGRTYPSSMFVCGDAGLTLAGLWRRLRGRMTIDARFRDDLAEARRKAADAYRLTLGAYADFPARFMKAMPRDAVFVRDATVAASSWGHRLTRVTSPGGSIHPVGAAIGPGLPLGIGAALAVGGAGRKAVALVGDGGFALNMTELWTAAQERAELCVIVMNDGGYAAIGHMQDVMTEGRRFYGVLRGPDLLRLAEVAGIPAWRVDRAEAFGEILARATATPGPTLVEVDMAAIGPAPPYSGLKAHAPKV